MDARVFVANFAGHDYSKAKKYGELVPITKGFVSMQGLDRLKFQIAEAIATTAPDDYLVLSGANIICVLSAVLWFQLHGKVRVLNLDKNTRDYREIVLTRENIDSVFTVLEA